MLKFIAPPFPAPVGAPHISKHLMLKFIHISGTISVRHIHFKTSYVEVYPYFAAPFSIESLISKHLMLKFILESHKHIPKRSLISKHLMLKFILESHKHIPKRSLISKHLMLKFIPISFLALGTRSYFKTSYVEVYRLTVPV